MLDLVGVPMSSRATVEDLAGVRYASSWSAALKTRIVPGCRVRPLDSHALIV